MMSYRIESGRITKKGQVTIPVEIRNQLNIEDGDRLDFIRETDGTYRIEVIKSKTIRNSLGKLKVEKALSFEQERKTAQEQAGLSKTKNWLGDMKDEDILD